MLNKLGSPESKRAYEFAIDGFVAGTARSRGWRSTRRLYCAIESNWKGGAWPHRRSTCAWLRCAGLPMKLPTPGC